MIVAPRSLASTTHWKATGWHSAMLEPSITMQSEARRSRGKSVAPPRPNEVPRPGTVEEERDGRAIMQCRGVAHLGGATLDNEENYLLKKFFTGGLGMTRVSNQARI